jgi:hypothetical protein
VVGCNLPAKITIAPADGDRTKFMFAFRSSVLYVRVMCTFVSNSESEWVSFWGSIRLSINSEWVDIARSL